MAARNELDDQDGNYDKDSPRSLEVRFAQSQLSRSRRQLIRAILDNYEETFFLSSREMAKRYNVDAATIVRTIQALGYERFADFAADLRKHFVNQITPYTVLKVATQERRSVTDRVRHCLERDSESLSVLRSSLDANRVIELARRVKRARRILVVGIDLAASLAWFLAYGLTPLGFDARAPVGSTGNLQHKIDVLTEKDLVIGISFGRCLRDTVEAVQRAHERGVPTFGVTDSDATPIATYCDGYLVASTSSPSFTGSYVAPLALINSIIVACAHIQPKRALAMLGRTEEEYRTGGRWYQEPLRRAKSETDGDLKAGKNNAKVSARQQG
ncbi:MAG TPA: MurR/RpiR family transcriptional regulator [Pyrinomonadaceae bacterium]|nr:MurR/RpiR family transcriptional regulator [Pyrinomonadaceae bacterium]